MTVCDMDTMERYGIIIVKGYLTGTNLIYFKVNTLAAPIVASDTRTSEPKKGPVQY